MVACQELSLQLLYSCGTKEYKLPSHQSQEIKGNPLGSSHKMGVPDMCKNSPPRDTGALEHNRGQAE